MVMNKYELGTFQIQRIRFYNFVFHGNYDPAHQYQIPSTPSTMASPRRGVLSYQMCHPPVQSTRPVHPSTPFGAPGLPTVVPRPTQAYPSHTGPSSPSRHV